MRCMSEAPPLIDPSPEQLEAAVRAAHAALPALAGVSTVPDLDPAAIARLRSQLAAVPAGEVCLLDVLSPNHRLATKLFVAWWSDPLGRRHVRAFAHSNWACRQAG